MLPTPLGFVNNCQCFLIFCNDLEGAYRKAFLVCKSGLYCHPRWMGSGDGLKDVREKWGAGKFVSPLLTSPPLTLTFFSAFFSLSLPLASASITSRFKFPPLKSALLLSSIYQLLHVGVCVWPFISFIFPPLPGSLSVCRFKQQKSVLCCSCPPGQMQVIPIFTAQRIASLLRTQKAF